MTPSNTPHSRKTQVDSIDIDGNETLSAIVVDSEYEVSDMLMNPDSDYEDSDSEDLGAEDSDSDDEYDEAIDQLAFASGEASFLNRQMLTTWSNPRQSSITLTDVITTRLTYLFMLEFRAFGLDYFRPFLWSNLALGRVNDKEVLLIDRNFVVRRHPFVGMCPLDSNLSRDPRWPQRLLFDLTLMRTRVCYAEYANAIYGASIRMGEHQFEGMELLRMSRNRHLLPFPPNSIVFAAFPKWLQYIVTECQREGSFQPLPQRKLSLYHFLMAVMFAVKVAIQDGVIFHLVFPSHPLLMVHNIFQSPEFRIYVAQCRPLLES